MKTILKIILIASLGLIVFGFYTNYGKGNGGELFIGSGVALFAFILMPLFIYHRYNGRDLSQYSLDNMLDNIENHKQEKEAKRKVNRKE